MSRTGDLIYSGYEEDTNYGLNVTQPYCELAIKTTCHCIPSWSLLKHRSITNRITSGFGQSWMHVANLARVAVEIIVGIACITVVFSMDKDNKIVIESLEEWCEFMLSLCESKVDNNEVPIMSKPAASYSNERSNFWGDERHRGSWLKYESVPGVGGSVSLQQVVAATYFCVFLYGLCMPS